MNYERYAEIRDSRGLTDYQVSKETGVSTATLSEWKSGKYKPKVDKLLKIADLFGISVEQFIRE